MSLSKHFVFNSHKKRCSWYLNCSEGYKTFEVRKISSQSLNAFFKRADSVEVNPVDTHHNTDSDSDLSDDSFLDMLDGHRGCQVNIRDLSEFSEKATETVTEPFDLSYFVGTALKIHHSDVEKAFQAYPLLRECLLNIINREDFYSDPSRMVHRESILKLFLKYSLQYSVKAAVEICVLVGGPCRDTLYKMRIGDIVPVWLSKFFISNILKTFLDICQNQGSQGTISAFLAVDGTALSTRLGYKSIPDTELVVLTGAASSMTTPIFIDREHNVGIGLTYRSFYKGSYYSNFFVYIVHHRLLYIMFFRSHIYIYIYYYLAVGLNDTHGLITIAGLKPFQSSSQLNLIVCSVEKFKKVKCFLSLSLH